MEENKPDFDPVVKEEIHNHDEVHFFYAPLNATYHYLCECITSFIGQLPPYEDNHDGN